MNKRIMYIAGFYAIVIVTLWMSVAIASGVSKDGAGDWRINTYAKGESQYPHMVFGLVYKPGKGITYEKFYGSTDTVECSNQIGMLRALAEARAYQILDRILKLLGQEDYTISMGVSVCHNEWYVIYISKGKSNAPKEVYEKVMKMLQ